jgi:hypothetical protein
MAKKGTLGEQRAFFVSSGNKYHLTTPPITDIWKLTFWEGKRSFKFLE